jgi:hypothetical protein
VHHGQLDQDPRLPHGVAAHEAVEVDSGEEVGGALEVDHMLDTLQQHESLDAVQELGDGHCWGPVGRCTTTECVEELRLGRSGGGCGVADGVGFDMLGEEVEGARYPILISAQGRMIGR